MKEVVIAATGHRPPKLGGYSEQVLGRLTYLAEVYLKQEMPDIAISGMALGWDTAFALAAIRRRIPLICAIPIKSQADGWPTQAKKRWYYIQEQTRLVHIVSLVLYSPQVMQTRNMWMVNNCTNGSYEGGTVRCLRYADTVGKPYDNLWEQWKGKQE